MDGVNLSLGNAYLASGSTYMDKTDNVNSMGAAEFEAVFEAAVDGICVIDSAGRILAINPAAERLFGYLTDELQGENISRIMPEPDRDHHDGYIQHFMTTGQARIIGSGREVQGLRRDGNTFPMHLSVGATPKHRFVGIMRDLTDQKEADERARHVQDQLAHVGRFSLMGEMAAGLAHEINQPLSAIATYAQAGERTMLGIDGLEDLTEICEKIAAQAERAGQVVQSLRRFGAKPEVRRDILELNQVVAEIKTLIDADAHADGIVVARLAGENLPPVLGDAIQLQQVIVNLTRNAIDAMQGGLRKEQGVEIRTYCEGDGVHVSVTDHGSGVPAQLVDSIFHPFVTTKVDGLGVGLAISQTIVQAHGGVLSYRVNPAGGAIFDFCLPIYKEPTDG
jgi:two-component system sensor kinase FixL